MEQGNHDWSWLGPVAGAVGVGLGAAGAVIAGAWKFLSRLGGGRDMEMIRMLENRVLVLETEARAERDVAARDRREALAMFEQIFEKSNATDAKVERALALLEKRK